MQIPILHCKICPWSILVVPENLTRKFNESREYTFKLDGDVSKGSIHVIVENKNKETILDLTPEIKTGMLTVDEKCRYFLIL